MSGSETEDGLPTLVSLWLDVFVHLPLGVAMEARRVVPELTQRGRTEVDQRINSYRAVGKLAAGQLRREAEKRFGDTATGDDPGPPDTPAPIRTDAATNGSEPVTAVADAPPVDDLPISAYDELSAVQIIPLLVDLDAGALDDVERYEAAHRGRRTILNKVNQLRSDG